MKLVPFIICVIITVSLIVVLNIPLTIAGNKTPRIGAFLSPQHGFWQNAEPADYDFNESLDFPDLRQKAEVSFDERLVPHIYAERESDAYFVQGYLHARFRLWQMEFQTHAAAGRLSEIMGETRGGTDFLKIDRYFRRLGMIYAAEQSLKKTQTDSMARREMKLYTEGVNAYISSLKPNQYPLEYKLLDYAPEKWTDLKSQLFLKYMAYELAGGDHDFEMTNAKNIFSPADIEKLYPRTADSLDPIVPKGTQFLPPNIPVKRPVNVDSVYYNFHDTAQTPFALQPNKNNGSNNWAVAGSKTKSGAPILCNDPHLSLNLPSLWYEMQISAPNFNVYGVSFPGSPSIIIGFNDSIAWGVTNAERDVKDYYEITFRDSTMNEYMYNGSWVKTAFRNEIIKVKGMPNVTEKIAMTVFGPVIYDKTYPDPLKDNKYYAVRWKAHDQSDELLTFNKLNHAKNFTDYIRAISTFQCPGQNFVFASKSGDIAIRQQGQFPAKWRRQGDFLMEGIDSSYAWKSFIPAKENPTVYNPGRGFVSSANQLATDTTYPYYLAGTPYIYRGLIINRMLRQMNNITIKDMERMQTDNYNVFAEMARPVLLKYIDMNKLSAAEKAYIIKFKNWNLRNDINEQGPTIFKLWWGELENAVFKDEFSKSDLPLRWPDESTLLEGLLRDSAYKFVDDVTTARVENIHDIVLRAYRFAYPQLKDADNKRHLAWGKYKDTGIRHLLKLPSFSRLHLPVGGGENIINATTGNHGPSWRMIVQLTKHTQAYGVYPGGQSGNPGSKYYDTFIDTWASGKYYPLLFLNHDEAKKNNNIKWTMTLSKTKFF